MEVVTFFPDSLRRALREAPPDLSKSRCSEPFTRIRYQLNATPGPTYRLVLLHARAVENARRELQGLSPMPLTEEERCWEREADKEFLKVGLLEILVDPGWQDPESQALLDEWEEALRCEA